jgi:hypothetical protein
MPVRGARPRRPWEDEPRRSIGSAATSTHDRIGGREVEDELAHPDFDPIPFRLRLARVAVRRRHDGSTPDSPRASRMLASRFGGGDCSKVIYI